MNALLHSPVLWPDRQDPTVNGHLAGLVARMARAELAALSDFYDATQQHVCGLLTRMLPAPACADSAIESAYQTAWEGAARYDPAQGPALAWLLRISHQAGLGHRRACPACAGVSSVPAGEAGRIEDGEGGEGDALLAAFIPGSAAHAALEALSARQRGMVFLMLFRGLECAGIAAALALPLRVVEAELAAALVALTVPEPPGTGACRVGAAGALFH